MLVTRTMIRYFRSDLALPTAKASGLLVLTSAFLLGAQSHAWAQG